jgi:hypothetical protein
VDATITGRTGVPSAVCHEHSSSTTTSNRPTVVPSAPVIRCSSSWMIRSGGRSRPTGRTLAADSRPSAWWMVVMSQPP